MNDNETKNLVCHKLSYKLSSPTFFPFCRAEPKLITFKCKEFKELNEFPLNGYKKVV